MCVLREVRTVLQHSLGQSLFFLFTQITVVVAFGFFRGTSALFSFTLGDDADYFGCGVLVTAMIITPLLLTCYIMGRFEIQKTIFVSHPLFETLDHKRPPKGAEQGVWEAPLYTLL